MARRIVNGVQLTQQCWKALTQYPQLMLFPLLSGIAMVLVSVVIVAPIVSGLLWFHGGQLPNQEDLSTAEWIILVLTSFLFYFANYMVIIFSNTALIGVSIKLLRGESATVSDGIGIAMSRLKQVIGFALISATIGTLAQLGKNSKRDSENGIAIIVASLIGGLIQGVWSVVVFFAIPVYVVENVGPIVAIRRSWEIFKNTWGESFTGRAVIGGAGCLVYFVLVVILFAILFIAVSLASILLIVLALLFGIVAFGAIALITGAINGVFQASLYQYATTGDAGCFITTDLARTAFPK